MRDQPLTIAEAAAWLGCATEEVEAHLAAERLKPCEGKAGTVSLNAVVVLAESLPVELGLFRVRDLPSGGDGSSGGFRPSSGYGAPGGGPRSGPIVERRPLRPRG